MITVSQLKKFLFDLPADMDNAPVSTVVSGCPCGLKRVVAWKDKKDAADVGVTLNSMGTHFDKSFWEENDITKHI